MRPAGWRHWAKRFPSSPTANLPPGEPPSLRSYFDSPLDHASFYAAVSEQTSHSENTNGRRTGTRVPPDSRTACSSLKSVSESEAKPGEEAFHGPYRDAFRNSLAESRRRLRALRSGHGVFQYRRCRALAGRVRVAAKDASGLHCRLLHGRPNAGPRRTSGGSEENVG